MEIVAYAGRGFEGNLVRVEVDLRTGIPGVDIVGLPDNAVKEARQRVRAGIRNSGFHFPRERVLINLAPAGIKKAGAGFDLPIAVALLLASGGLLLPAEKEAAFPALSLLVLGELELSGRVRGVGGALAAVGAAMEAGVSRFLVPMDNLMEVTAAAGDRAAGIAALSELPRLLRLIREGKTGALRSIGRSVSLAGGPEQVERAGRADFAGIRGAPLLRRALEIAAAGRHHLLLFGPPGSGKTMAADCFPSILPDLPEQESLEVTRIHSLLPSASPGGRVKVRPPVRNPHHSATREGLIGGEREEIPGEVALAHHGVLFLDEALEFRENLLQSLREPIERGRVDISRSGSSYWFPCRFQLILATNVCPCGRLGSEEGGCGCTEKEIARYWRKLGAALLDRIDIRIPCGPVEPDDLLGPEGENSSAVRQRVAAARAVQSARYETKGVVNGFLDDSLLSGQCLLNTKARSLFTGAIKHCGFSSRAAGSLLRVARTISDLAGEEYISADALAEAVALRRFGDRDLFWRHL
jgi:magnesium chelatase family protein